MTQLDLTDYRPQGSTINPEHDLARLSKQCRAVWAVTNSGQWMTLREISTACGAPEASISARLRQLRAMGWTVNRRRRGDPKLGLHEYSVVAK